MSNIKERIIGAITVMSEENAEKVWALIETNFSTQKWEEISEVEPDATDLSMVEAIENEPDCHVFISQAEVYSELGL